MLRCKSRPRLEELSLAIREGDIDFAAAAIRFLKALKVPRAVVLDPFLPDAGHPELNDKVGKGQRRRSCWSISCW